MAKQEKIFDDQTGKPIKYPYISVRSIRIDLSPTEYVWIGEDDIKTFGTGQSLGEWATAKLAEVIDNRPY